MWFEPNGGGGAALAAALVNLPPDAGAAEIGAAMLACGDSRPPPNPAQARALLVWARQLAEVFGEVRLDRRVELVNGLLLSSASRPYVSTHDGKAPHLHYAPHDCDTATGIRAFTAAGLAVVVCGDPGRLGRCAGSGCDTVFVDTSRNGRRRFCGTRCATRSHVADHRARRTATRSM